MTIPSAAGWLSWRGIARLGVFATGVLPLGAQTADRVRPTLVASVPPRGATGIDPTTPLRLTFSEPMKPQQRILWITSPQAVTTNDVTYSWSADALELTVSAAAGWPGRQTINWILQVGTPAIPGFAEAVPGFEDLAGNPISGGVGTFTTTAGGPPPWLFATNSCGVVSSNQVRTRLRLELSSLLQQTNAAGPLVPFSLSAAAPWIATATLQPGQGSATAAVVDAPARTTLSLTNLGGRFVRSEGFASWELMSAAWPAGTYGFRATGPSGDVPAEATVIAPSEEWPSLRVENFDALRKVRGTNDVQVTWTATGLRASDAFRVVVRPMGNPTLEVWRSPDPGCPGALDGTALGAEIPFEALKGGSHFYADLEVTREGFDVAGGGGSVSEFVRRSITRVGVVLCATTGVPQRERDPRGLSDLCDDPEDGATNVLRLVGLPVREAGRIRLRVASAEVGATYQVYRFDILPVPDRRGLKVARTLIGGSKIAVTSELEFEVPLESGPGSWLFDVGRTGRR